MGTKQNPGNYDCHAAAAPDEPLFTLLGRDRHAPTLIWLWATLRELQGEDAAKVAEARDVAMNMLEWGHARGRKYSGLSESTMAGFFELMRVANFKSAELAGKPEPEISDIDRMRLWLARTKFDPMDAPGS